MPSRRPRVWISQFFYPDLVEKLGQYFDVEYAAASPEAVCHTADGIAAALVGVDGALVTATETIGAFEVANARQLRVVANVGVGYNHIAIDAMSERGIYVTNTPGVSTETTADMAFALLLATARRLAEGDRFIRSGQWTNILGDLLWGQDVFGATLGILGMGRIGQCIARRGYHGFGMRVIYHNRTQLPSSMERAVGARYVDFKTLLRQSDFLMLMLPYQPENHHLIDAAALSQMQPHACLINMARGGIVDENALVQAIQDRRLAAAGLDVFEGEPSVNPALFKCPSIVMTPHLGMATRQTHRAMVRKAVNNLIELLRNGDGVNYNDCVVNAELVHYCT